MFPTVDALLAFAAVVAILTITPGLDTALVLRSATIAGPRRAWGAITGIVLGCLAWGVLASAGVGAIVAASHTAYTVLKVAGAAYVTWIGARMVWAAVRGKAALPDAATAGDTFVAGLRQGALTNLLNPKIGAFYVALLPQFIPHEASAVVWGVTLAGVHAALGVVWLGALALVAARARAWLRRPRTARVIDGVAGTAIVGLGVKLAATP